MKTLYLVRHAKSSWDYPDLSDHDRPLNKRGRKSAPKVGEALKEEKVKPDLIVSSSAVRAITTADIVAKELGFESEDVKVNEKIYGTDRDELLEIIRGTDEKAKSLMLFGHNPTLTDLATFLTSEPIVNIPTAGAMGIEFDVDTWQEVGKQPGKLLFFITPKKLEEKK